jgi:hypothetical protein
MEEYFPETGSNLTAVTWAHAVNSRQQLEDAVRGKNTVEIPAKNWLS